MVGGEPRSLMLYAQQNSSTEDIITRWQKILGDHALIRSKRQAIDDGVFGQVDTRAEAVLGDVLVQARDAYTIVDSRIQTEKAMSLPSVHGSMTRMEVDIPCLIDVA